MKKGIFEVEMEQFDTRERFKQKIKGWVGESVGVAPMYEGATSAYNVTHLLTGKLILLVYLNRKKTFEIAEAVEKILVENTSLESIRDEVLKLCNFWVKPG